MQTTFQFKTQNMLDHGIAVLDAFHELRSRILADDLDYLNGIRFPVEIGKDCLHAIINERAFNTYLIYHDCGKPDCLETDDQGRQHFPNHASVSKAKFLAFALQHKELPLGTAPYIADHIGMDMDFHTLRGSELETLCRHPLAPCMYLAAWASLLANAEMFGGATSDSYKIKAKRLCKAGYVLRATWLKLDQEETEKGGQNAST